MALARAAKPSPQCAPFEAANGRSAVGPEQTGPCARDRVLGRVVSARQDGERQWDAGAIRRRHPPAVITWNEPGEARPHGPIVLFKRLDPKTLADERSDGLADGMVPLV